MVREEGTDAGNDILLELSSAGGAGILRFDSSFRVWSFTGGNFFTIATPQGAGTEFTLDANGNLTVTGDVFSSTCTTPCAPPDYVFDEDYPLLPLADLETFVQENRHLPNVPPGDELVGPVNMSRLQMTLLEKVEELTLYVIEQDRINEQQQEEIAALRHALEAKEQAQ